LQQFEPGHLALLTFNFGGTASFDIQGDVLFTPVQTPEHGLWKRTGDRTFIATFLDIEYNRGDQYDATIFAQETLTSSIERRTSPGTKPQPGIAEGSRSRTRL
jgi:hypothetical protein